ncbi:hypothetical protein M3Y97_00683700 [Aphelenchoides bicaudatus]|nr:hypothetical protein M3Y97_00683700 [Aphelenchoides bicaudatus]
MLSKPLSAENFTRVKWEIENFPEFFKGSRYGPKYSHRFGLFGDSGARFVLVIDSELEGPDFSLGLTAIELKRGKSLETTSRFWIENNEGAAFMRSEDIKHTFTNKNDYFHCQSKFTPEVYYSVYKDGLTICCEIKTRCPVGVVKSPNSVSFIRQRLAMLCEIIMKTYVNIIANGHTFKVKRDVLFSKSPALTAMIMSTKFYQIRTGKIKLDDYNDQTVFAFVHWLTNNEILPTASLDDLFSFADRFIIRDLRHKCYCLMHSTLKDDNMIQHLICATRHNLNHLSKYILEYLVVKSPTQRMKLFQCGEWHQFSLKNKRSSNRVLSELESMAQQCSV